MSNSDIDGTVEKIDLVYRSGREKRKKEKTISRSLTLSILLVFSGFLITLLFKMQSMYAMENFEEPLRREAKILTPPVRNHLTRVLEEVRPTYVELARSKFGEALPVAREKARKELDILGNNLATHAEKGVNDVLDDFSRQQEERLLSHFGENLSQGRQKEIADIWMKHVKTHSAEFLVDFQNQYSGDVARLQKQIDSFRSERFENMDRETLMRYFVHLWLIRLDLELMREIDEGGAK